MENEPDACADCRARDQEDAKVDADFLRKKSMPGYTVDPDYAGYQKNG